MSDNDTPTNDTPTNDTTVDDAGTAAAPEATDAPDSAAEQFDLDSVEEGAPRRRFFTGRKALALATVIGLGLGVGGYALADAVVGGDHARNRNGHYEMDDHAPMGERGGMPHGRMDGHGAMDGDMDRDGSMDGQGPMGGAGQP